MVPPLKHLHHEFEPDRFLENALNDAGTASGTADPLLSGGAASSAFGLDVGTLYRFGRGLKYSTALVIRNINRPDVSLSGSGDKAPLGIKLGAAYKPRWGALTTEVRRIKRLSSQADTEAAIGAERRFDLGESGAFTLRAGYAEGSRSFKAANMGASYEFQRAELDYAFNFPLGNLEDTQGTHRVGFSYKVGTVAREIEDIQRDRKWDLLASYRNDAETSYVLLERSKKTNGINQRQRFALLQYLLNKHSQDQFGIKDIRGDITALLATKKYYLNEWPDIRTTMVKGLNEQDKINMGKNALDRMVSGDTSFGLARVGLFTAAAKRDPVIRSLTAISNGELAAQAYRVGDIDGAINHTRQILEVMPNDEVVTVAYRQLLLMRMQNQTRDLKLSPTLTPMPQTTTPQAPQRSQPGAVSIPLGEAGFEPSQYGIDDLPEAPHALRAPQAVAPTERQGISEFDADVRAFGTSLGYYFTRKISECKHHRKKLILLQQMKSALWNQRN